MTPEEIAEIQQHEAEVREQFEALEKRLKRAEIRIRRLDTEKALALKAAERHLARVKELEATAADLRDSIVAAACALQGMRAMPPSDVQEILHEALGIDFDADPRDLQDGGDR